MCYATAWYFSALSRNDMNIRWCYCKKCDAGACFTCVSIISFPLSNRYYVDNSLSEVTVSCLVLDTTYFPMFSLSLAKLCWVSLFCSDGS